MAPWTMVDTTKNAGTRLFPREVAAWQPMSIYISLCSGVGIGFYVTTGLNSLRARYRDSQGSNLA